MEHQPRFIGTLLLAALTILTLSTRIIPQVKRLEIAAMVICSLLVLELVLVGCGGLSPTPSAPPPSPAPAPTPTRGELIVHFIDVGQGDSILVDLGETEVLIDG